MQSNTDDDGAFAYKAHVRPGDDVEIMRGPFAQQIGVLADLDDRGRVSILLQIMWGTVKVKTTLENLIPA